LKTKTIQAILFDMDGVIADTQVAHSHVENETLKQKGIITTPEALLREFSGNTDRVLFRTMLSRAGLNSDEKAVDEMTELKKKLIDDYFKIHKIQFIPGARELIQGFHALGFPMAIASSSPKHFIEFVVKELELASYFQALTSGHEVPKSKPDPAIFLLAAKKIDATPQHCLVLEDAIHGMNAAKSAGMFCLGLWDQPTSCPADHQVKTFSGLSAQAILGLFQ
jgi:HAD superfamily hydrolase (TIGR01509 family)